MDAIALLKADHAAVEDLFKKFEASGQRAYKSKRKLVDRISKELSVHAAIEEQVFYPSVKEALPDLGGDVLEAVEEHHIVKWTLSELEDLAPEAENFDAKVTVLAENVRHHVKEEEKDLFPKLRKALTRGELATLGEALAQAKEAAPTRPHPRSPSTPPGNLVAGAVAGVVDKAREAGAAALGR